ncbi:MAG TPA: BON domain-containing protein [Methylomirabilota bacterium]|nr:BON domain-containing protein [Methylomirabilota bacterium]
MTKLSASVVVGLALAASPAWVSAADEKKSTEEKSSTTQAVKTNVSDSWITSKAKIALFADSRVPGASVHVETQKGMVYLRGKVESDEAKKAAEDVARGVEGVQGVKNELQVVPASAKKMVEAKDDDITKQVKERFKADPKLKSLDIRTDNGVVTLQGKLPSINDSARASQMAREVPGVRSVRNDTTYESPRASMSSDKMSSDKPSLKERVSDKTSDMKHDMTASNAAGQTHVRAAQEKLKEKGFDPGPIDGVWGPRTAAAVSDFQRSENLKVTSRLDAETLGKLDVGVGGATRPPQTK